jgi:hypothetical protein
MPICPLLDEKCAMRQIFKGYGAAYICHDEAVNDCG